MLDKDMKGDHGREEFLFLNPIKLPSVYTLKKKDNNCSAGGELIQVGLDWQVLQGTRPCCWPQRASPARPPSGYSTKSR